MATSYPPFVSGEYVTRWLSDVRMEASVDVQTPTRHPRHAQRKRACNPGQSVESDIHPSPRTRPQKITSGRSSSPIYKELHCLQETSVSGDVNQAGDSRSSSSERLVNTLARHHISAKSRSPRMVSEDPSRKYARRPRHKTRPDRYEYKGDAVKDVSAKRALRKTSKRSRREKTGNTLSHNFKAPNVKQERLTLKTDAGPGIFGKGRASVRLQTSGLPDLTFSEMNFLSKKRLLDYTQLDEQKPRKSAKKGDKSKEISEFFAQPPGVVARRHQTFSEAHYRQYSIGYTREKNSAALSSPAKMSTTTELGSPPDNMSAPCGPVEATGQITTSDGQKAIDKIGRNNRSVRSGVRASYVVSKPTEAETSHCSWSVTQSRPGSRHHSVIIPANATMLNPQPMQQPELSPLRESSITNSSLDLYAKQALLPRDQDSRRLSHRAPLGSDLYSLDDLKGLARLAQIEEKYRGLSEIAPQNKRSVEPGLVSAILGVSAPHSEGPELRERMYLAISKPDMDNFTETQVRRISGVTPGLFQLPIPPLGNRQEYEVQQKRLARSVRQKMGATARLEAHGDQPLHHAGAAIFRSDREFEYHYEGQGIYHIQQRQPLISTQLGRMDQPDGGTFDERYEKYIDSERSALYQDTEHDIFDPALVMFPDVGHLGFGEYAPDTMEPDNDIPQLENLHYGAGPEERGSMRYEQALARQVFEEGQQPLTTYISDACHNSGHRDVPYRGEEAVLMWEGPTMLYPVEMPEEEFLGFSRPQILYQRRTVNRMKE